MPIRRNKTAAVIVAAGQSLRMAGVDKQLTVLAGLPVLVRSLLAFEVASTIDEIVVVTRADDRTLVKSWAETYNISKLKAVVAGGDTRAESVRCGFARISPDMRFVAVHDGARCLITPENIEKVCRAAYRHNAATAAYPATDTVKIADRNGFIVSTPPRKTVWHATTPQVFHADLYRAALAIVDLPDATDDNQLIEKLPVPVKLVDCGRQNIKITYPDDLKIAEILLKEREAQT
jgi:2-C-methyl-D-erythritol 4-phosphate cytidylyltransferase